MTVWSSTIELAGSNPNWKKNISTLLDEVSWSDEILPVVKKVRNSERLDLNDGILLYNHLDIFELGF